MIDLSIFKGQRVFITGVTGFKGSWLAFWLSQLGAEIVGYALPPEPHQQLFDALDLRNRIRYVSGDIRDFEYLNRTITEFSPTFIFHLAAQPLVRLSYQLPRETFSTNILGSTHILEVARTCSSLRVLVYITSDKCYQNNEWVWGYRENDILGGRDPYGASKAAAEIVFASYVDSFFSKMSQVGVASVRAGNVIGGGDWSIDRIVPDSIKALQKNFPVQVRSPHATRPWQHVLEPLSGYLQLATYLYQQPKQYEGSWNFGPDASSVQRVEQVVDEIIQVWGEGKKEVTPQGQKGANKLYEAGLLRLNCDKAHELLCWRPQWGFSTAIRHTVEWYKQVHQGQDAAEITRDQLAIYMKAMQR